MIVYLRLLRPDSYRGFGGRSPSKSKCLDLIAQLVEHLPFKERVLGSSPSQVTRESKTHPKGGFLF